MKYITPEMDMSVGDTIEYKGDKSHFIGTIIEMSNKIGMRINIDKIIIDDPNFQLSLNRPLFLVNADNVKKIEKL